MQAWLVRNLQYRPSCPPTCNPPPLPSSAVIDCENLHTSSPLELLNSQVWEGCGQLLCGFALELGVVLVSCESLHLMGRYKCAIKRSLSFVFRLRP